MPCNKCGEGYNRCNCSCKETKTKCAPLRYKGGDIECLNIECGDSFESIVQKITDPLCNLPFKDGDYVEINEEPAGANCDNGGIQVVVKSGEDDSVISTNYICQPSDGEDADCAPTQTTGTNITFSEPFYYNTPAEPGTTNITDDFTGAIFGMQQKIYHNNAIAPTFPAGWVRLGNTVYIEGVLNIIYVEWVGGTRVEYWILQEAE